MGSKIIIALLFLSAIVTCLYFFTDLFGNKHEKKHDPTNQTFVAAIENTDKSDVDKNMPSSCGDKKIENKVEFSDNTNTYHVTSQSAEKINIYHRLEEYLPENVDRPIGPTTYPKTNNKMLPESLLGKKNMVPPLRFLSLPVSRNSRNTVATIAVNELI